MLLLDVPPPRINSNLHDLLHDGRPTHGPLESASATWVDSDWASCPQTRRSSGGTCVRIAGGPTGYRSGLHPTVEGSSTEAEYVEAYKGGKLTLFCRSVLYDVGVPQSVATLVYEDNDACIAMANSRKPTSRTRYMDIKYFALA
ncbi:hypothetical protein ACHAWF_013913, partial [Thalassiosira exigua]